MRKKRRSYILVGGLLLVLGFICTGCNMAEKVLHYVKSKKTDEPYVSREARLYNEAVDDFFAALDARDKDALREMFAPSVQRDTDLDVQIESLLAAYAGPTDICNRDGGMVAGAYENEYGTKRAEVESCFPVISGGRYYWCYFKQLYRNDSDKKEVGITELTFYSAEYFCAVCYDDDHAEMPDEPGLHVLTDYTMDCEVRAVEGYPYKYQSMERTLTEAEAKEFLKTSGSYSAFTEHFGEPNAEDIYIVYELVPENEEKRYLRLTVDERTDEIISAGVVDDLEWLHMAWNEKETEE